MPDIKPSKPREPFHMPEIMAASHAPNINLWMTNDIPTISYEIANTICRIAEEWTGATDEETKRKCRVYAIMRDNFEEENPTATIHTEFQPCGMFDPIFHKAKCTFHFAGDKYMDRGWMISTRDIASNICKNECPNRCNGALVLPCQNQFFISGR